MSALYYRTIIEDPEHPGELALDLGQELCDTLGWREGDTLEWQENRETGEWILTKVTTTQ